MSGPTTTIPGSALSLEHNRAFIVGIREIVKLTRDHCKSLREKSGNALWQLSTVYDFDSGTTQIVDIPPETKLKEGLDAKTPRVARIQDEFFKRHQSTVTTNNRARKWLAKYGQAVLNANLGEDWENSQIIFWDPFEASDEPLEPKSLHALLFTSFVHFQGKQTPAGQKTISMEEALGLLPPEGRLDRRFIEQMQISSRQFYDSSDFDVFGYAEKTVEAAVGTWKMIDRLKAAADALAVFCDARDAELRPFRAEDLRPGMSPETTRKERKHRHGHRPPRHR